MFSTFILLYTLWGGVLAFVCLGLVFPHALRGYSAAVTAFLAMACALFLPQILIIDGFLSALLVGWRGMNAHLLQVGLSLHLLSWSLALVHLRRVSRSKPILKGGTIPPPVLEEGEEKSSALLEPTWAEEWVPALTWRIREMNAVDVEKGIVYREVDGVRLKADIYRAIPRKRKAPALLYIHGGGWVAGSRRQSRYLCHRLARTGWTVIAVSYRLAPRFPLPAGLIDAKAALAWLRDNADELDIDARFIVVAGGSAGGHLALMLGLTENDPRFQPGFESSSTQVDGVLAFYPVTDFTSPFERGRNVALGTLLERVVIQRPYESAKDVYQALQPVSYVRPDVPPILVVHGQNDELVPIHESRRFIDLLRRQGADAYLLEVPAATHAFEVAPGPLERRTFPTILAFVEGIRAAKRQDDARGH